MSMRQLDELERFRDAYDLVRSGMRVSIICALTGVTPHFVKQMWVDVHNEASRSGQLPASVHVFIKDPSIAASLSGFVSHCQSRYKDLREALSARALLDLTQQYNWVAGTTIDITSAYYAVRDTAAGIVERRYCGSCDTHHLYSPLSFQMRGCPFCRLVNGRRAA